MPTPTPSASSGLTADTASLLAVLPPAVIAAALTLAGTILLFIFQQRAAARVAQQKRFDDAFEQLVELVEAMRTSIATKQPIDQGRVIVALYRLTWLLAQRNQRVAKWITNEVTRCGRFMAREEWIDARNVLTEVVARVVEWRVGDRKLRYFKELRPLPTAPDQQEGD